MALENNDISWVLDLVTAIEQDLATLNNRLSNLERVYKADRQSITNILGSNNDILDGITAYTSNLSKEINSLREIAQSRKPKSSYE